MHMIKRRCPARGRWGFFLLPALIAGLLWSCSEPGDKPVEARRVVVAYLCGNNNLSAEVAQKAEALTTGFATCARVGDRLLIFRVASGEEPVLEEVSREGNRVETRLVRSYDGYDSAGAGTLASVVTTVRARYPGASFCLVVFSHASGWLPEGMYQNPLLPPSPATTRSVIGDNGNEMELAEFAGALPDGMFDCVVFETCFMAGVEVAWELRHKTLCLVVSSAEILSPGFTPVYPSALGYLFAGDAEGFARAAFAAADSLTGWRCSATYSVIRTAGLPPLKTFLAGNADPGTGVNIFDVQHFDRNTYRLFFDLEDYYQRQLKTNSQRTELSRLIAACVTWKAATPLFMEGHGGFRITRHCGLTTYIPQPEFIRLNEAYSELSWNR